MTNVAGPNVPDNKLRVGDRLCSYMYRGKIFGDAGYISQKLFEALFQKGITLLTKTGKNMKNKRMPMRVKIYLKKKSQAKTV